MSLSIFAPIFGFAFCLFVAAGITFFAVVIPLSVFASEKIRRLFEGTKAALAVWLISSVLLATYIFVNHKDFAGGAEEECIPSQTERRC